MRLTNIARQNLTKLPRNFFSYVLKIIPKKISTLVAFVIAVGIFSQASHAEIPRILDKSSQQVISSDAATSKPKLHAIVIGINQFNNLTLNLKYSVPDAQAIFGSLNQQIGGLYSKGTTTLLTTKHQTSKASIINAIKDIQNKADINDVFVFYAVSHGYSYPDTGYHLFTSDVGQTSSVSVANTAINAEQLQESLAQIKANKKLVVLDTCGAGGAIDAGAIFSSRGLNDQMAVERMELKSGATVVMSGCNSQQKNLVSYNGHGLLTYTLLQALDGKANTNADNYINTVELTNYIKDTIPALTKREFNSPQYPNISRVGDGISFKVVD